MAYKRNTYMYFASMQLSGFVFYELRLDTGNEKWYKPTDQYANVCFFYYIPCT